MIPPTYAPGFFDLRLRLRLHFRNAETAGHAPLGIARRDRRLADLAALFACVKRTLPESLQVVGASGSTGA